MIVHDAPRCRCGASAGIFTQGVFLMYRATLWAAALVAAAHAFMESAVPAVGSTVSAPPKEVAITFSEAVEPDFSGIEVADAAGKRVDSGKAHLAPGNHQVLAVDLLPLTAGPYIVTWHATSVDTHKTKGSYRFSVAP
jgi:hypothetical protein